MAVLAAVQRLIAIIDGKRKEYVAVLTGGPANAYQIAALGPNGRYDISMMPEGVGPNTDIMTFTEAVAAGRLVNVYNAGTDAAPVFSARLADGGVANKEAHGFVLTAVAKDAQGTVYGLGENTALTGLKPGAYYLSGIVPGGVSPAPADGAGTTYQEVGVATSSGVLIFRRGEAITRA